MTVDIGRFKRSVVGYFKLLTFFVCWGIGGWVGWQLANLYKASREGAPDGGRIYYHRYGSSYCGSFAKEDCGITLWNCADDRVYTCLHDVGYSSDAK